jgi:hypothetical protein
MTSTANDVPGIEETWIENARAQTPEINEKGHTMPPAEHTALIVTLAKMPYPFIPQLLHSLMGKPMTIFPPVKPSRSSASDPRQLERPAGTKQSR